MPRTAVHSISMFVDEMPDSSKREPNMSTNLASSASPKSKTNNTSLILSSDIVAIYFLKYVFFFISFYYFYVHFKKLLLTFSIRHGPGVKVKDGRSIVNLGLTSCRAELPLQTSYQTIDKICHGFCLWTAASQFSSFETVWGHSKAS